jgi:hypothetical protein
MIKPKQISPFDSASVDMLAHGRTINPQTPVAEPLML